MIARSLATALPNLAGVVVVTFALTHLLPGDPAAYFAGPSATAASVEQTRHALGLDRSLPEQFLGYVAGLAHGDFGRSLTSGQRVIDDIASRLPASLELTGFALVAAVGFGLLLGTGAAMRPHGWPDRLCGAIATLGQAIPTFFLGLLLVLVFYYWLGWAPAPLGRLDILWSPPPTVTGFWSLDAALAGDWPLTRAVLGQLVLPVATLAAFGIGPMALVTRASMMEALGSDFMRTARAAGLSRRTMLWGYTFPNALIPILNTGGIVFSYMLGAAVLVEKVYGWPGIGAYAIDAVLASDFAPVQGFVLAMAALYLVLNLAIDVASGLIDPRIRRDG